MKNLKLVRGASKGARVKASTVNSKIGEPSDLQLE